MRRDELDGRDGRGPRTTWRARTLVVLLALSGLAAGATAGATMAAAIAADTAASGDVRRG